MRWPPRLSQKYARRDGVETDVCQQFVNRCHSSLSQKYARRDGVETRPYQCGERQSCGSPAPPAPLPRCGPCSGLHVCLRNTLGGTGLKSVPTNAVKDSRRPLLPSLTQPAGLKPVPTNAMKDSHRPLLPSLTQPAGLKPVPTNAMKDSHRPLLPSLTQPAGLKSVPTNAVKDRAAGRPHSQPHSRAAGEGGS